MSYRGLAPVPDIGEPDADPVITPTPRPAAVDLNAARGLANGTRQNLATHDPRCQRGFTTPDVHVLTMCGEIDKLAADLAATRAERDAARVALPDARVLNSIAAVLEVDGKGYTADILRRWANTIDDAHTAPAPVPAADVPAFLARRVS